MISYSFHGLIVYELAGRWPCERLNLYRPGEKITVFVKHPAQYAGTKKVEQFSGK